MNWLNALILSYCVGLMGALLRVKEALKTFYGHAYGEDSVTGKGKHSTG